MLACIQNDGKAAGRPIMACHTALRQFPSNMLHAVLDKTTGHLMEMRHLLMNPNYKELWGKSYTKKLRHLAQGIPGVSKCTDTIVSICHEDILHDRKCKFTYVRVCVNYCPEKEEPNHTLVTVGSNLLHYPGNCGTPTVNMITVKLHLNSIILTKNACYCTINLKDFYLNTPMEPTKIHVHESQQPPS